MMRVKWGCSALFAAVSLLGAACGSSGDKAAAPAGSAGTPQAAPKADYKIGFIGILSGSVATLGQAYQAGFDNYFQNLNARGGVNGHKIDFVVADDRNDPATGIAAYKQMVASDKVLAVFGLIGSNVATGVQKVADTLKTPIVGTGVVPPTGDYSFVAGLDPVQSFADEAPLLQHLAKQRNISNPKVQIISVDTVSGHASVGPFTKVAEGMGMTIVGTRFEPPALTQFGTQAGEITSNSPDFVVMNFPAAGLGVVSKALRQAGYTKPIVNYWVGASEQALAQLNDPGIYVYRDFADPSEAAAGPMRAAAKAKGVSDGLEFSSGNYYTQGYVMGQLAEQILKKCGDDCNPSKFRDLLASDASKIDTSGLTAKDVGFSATRHVFIGEVRYWRWDANAKKSVPVEGKESAPAY